MFRLLGPLVKRIDAIEIANEIHVADIERRVGELERLLQKDEPEMADGSSSSQMSVSAKEAAENVRNQLLRGKTVQKDPYIYAGCSGIVGAGSILLGACVSKLVVQLFSGDYAVVQDFRFFLMVFGMASTLILQTALLNSALKLGDAMAVYPVFQAFWIGFGTIGGAVLYHTSQDFSGFQWGVYFIALVLMLVGIYCLAQHPLPEYVNMEAMESAIDMQYGQYSDARRSSGNRDDFLDSEDEPTERSRLRGDSSRARNERGSSRSSTPRIPRTQLERKDRQHERARRHNLK